MVSPFSLAAFRKSVMDRFEATAIRQVSFSDYRAFQPGTNRNAPTLDTVIFTGTTINSPKTNGGINSNSGVTIASPPTLTNSGTCPTPPSH